MEATDIFDREKYPAFDNEDGSVRVKGNFYSGKTIVLDSELYKYSTKILREEKGYFETLTETEELVVYTVFSPTDYRFQMVQFQNGEETYKQVPAFVSKMMKKEINVKEYNAINCIFYGEVSYFSNPIIFYKGKKSNYGKSIGNNEYQFFFLRE